MFLSIKQRKSLSRFLAWSLVVVGLTQSMIRPSNASHETTPTQLTPIVKESNEKAAPEASAVDESTKARISAAYNKLPLRFEENRGQVDTQVKFISRGSGSTLFLTPTEAVLTLVRGEKEKETEDEAFSAGRPALPSRSQASPLSIVRMKLHGANRSPLMSGESEMSARTNYFIGDDPQQWRGDVAQYERVRYAKVYPGIDMLYYGQQQSLEYDFEVAPGTDPRQIMLGFKGIRRLKIEAVTGDLLLETAGGEIRQSKPVVYQEVDGERREVEGRYVVKGKRKVGFKIGAYDKTKTLVIDPVLKYSTYLGGSAFETGNGIAIDSAGNAYVTGQSSSTNFPILNQYQTAQELGDAFVTKLNLNLSGAASLLYSTYLGGNSVDTGFGIAADSAGNAYVTGSTQSTNFPILNQYQTDQGSIFDFDAFVTKLNTNLSGAASLLYSTYLGGSDSDRGSGIAVDSTGNAYVTGNTSSADFPILNQYQTNQGSMFDVDAFVTKLNPNLSGAASLLYSTYLGGSDDDRGNGIAVDSSGNAYVTGSTQSTNFPTLNQYQTAQGSRDAFVTRINTNLSGTASLVYSTYLGGSTFDTGSGIAIDSAGNAYLTGSTDSTNFPALNQYQTDQVGLDVFVTKLNTNLSGAASLLYSTYLGGFSDDAGFGIAVDSSGNAYVTGNTFSNNFPILYQYQTYQGLSRDAFVTKLNTNLSGTASLVYSTYLGGSGDETGNSIAVDAAGNAYVTGSTISNNFPTLNQYQTFQGANDVFVTKLGVAPILGDFDADRKTDLALWHPTDGNWEIIRNSNNSTTVQQWGTGSLGDKPVPGDYDGDGKADLAVWRPSNAIWYIRQSSKDGFRAEQWGASEDKPVPADYDADGKTDLAVYRPSEGIWYILQSSNSGFRAIQWGNNEDKPVPADYDGDQRADVAVFRPSTSVWHILQSSFGVRTQQWGFDGDKPVAGDYDADGKTDVAVWRPSDGNWYVLRSSNGSLYSLHWGVRRDRPVPGDYDADGKTDIAVWRPTTGRWYILKSSDGSVVEQQFGSSGDIPVPSAYLPD